MEGEHAQSGATRQRVVKALQCAEAMVALPAAPPWDVPALPVGAGALHDAHQGQDCLATRFPDASRQQAVMTGTAPEEG